MSTPTTARPQICLPGQAHVAEGPHDQTGMYLMHHAFRRDLAAFEEAVRQTPLHGDGTWRLLQRRWDRFVEVLHHHHEAEDAHIWPVMLAQVSGEDRRVLEAMEAEHGSIDPALEACTNAFAEMAAHPCADHRNALDVRVTSVRALLADHLRHEETEALPLLQRTFSVEQNTSMEKAISTAYPPRLVPFLVPWVIHGVPDEVAVPFLRESGRVYAVLLRVLRPRFARAERRVFRHV
ncbi:hemerythrin domain-containing protein [Nocardioides sp. HDW12B]|uniref:hemerythrin domain-containing protein n=1 Tax=Nocardioides sp. HDW12B TaxID=2714939 RepID=UPI00140DA914|nr:hemerythrin domain-containing protein [Nocardioides sp. HDW12B]QIK66724.1 hemerythrin domain-containing protein [Nocardioides sp. HDW12B]